MSSAAADFEDLFGDDGDEAGEGGGAPVDADAIEVPPGMTADAFFALFCKHVAVVEAGYAEVIEEAQRSVKDRGLDEQALETYLKLLLQRKMPDMLAKAQAAVGLDEEVFRNCLMKWQSVRGAPRRRPPPGAGRASPPAHLSAPHRASSPSRAQDGRFLERIQESQMRQQSLLSSLSE